MSQATPFLGIPALHGFDGSPAVEGETEDFGEDESDEGAFRWTRTRILSHRDTENLGMWAASLKIMAGTQHLLPNVPTHLPFSRRRRQPSPRSFPPDFSPSDPPSSPAQTPSSPTTRDGESPARGVLQEVSAACTKLMQLAQTLERRTNAERRLSRKNRRRTPLAAVVRFAAPSTAPDVGDDMPCRVATVHPPRPSDSTSIDIVGVVSDAPPWLSPLVIPSPPSPPSPPTSTTYVDVATEPQPPPISCDAGVLATTPPRVFSDVAISTDDLSTDPNTTYGFISDPVARSLAHLLPYTFERERKLTQAIYLTDWLDWAEWFPSLPPTQRVYLNVLAEIFRPWCDPQQGHSLALGLNPVYNLFTHWWSGWNAIGFPGRPPETNPRRRYDYVTDLELDGQIPMSGRGFLVHHASGF
ncbi:hypothetical protein DFH09DRAFT_1291646 [Mycena vulgaris]|nr:hypothetical protein DFH09DRAFT_1291646 [Mycena vulgaris]